MSGANEMDASRAYDIDVTLDGRWVQLPLREEIDASTWAEALVDEALALRGRTESPQRHMVYVQMWAAVLESERARPQEPDRDMIAVYCLLPGDDVDFVATVHLQGVSMFLGMSMDDLVDECVLPEEQRYRPPVIGQVETSYGTCQRISQIAVDEEGEMATSILFAWPTPDDGIYIVMAAYFSSPVEAAIYEDVVEELASSFTLAAAS